MKLCAYVAGHLGEVSDGDVSKLDVINLAFGVLRDGILFYRDAEEAGAAIRRWKAVNQKLSVLLSVGGWGAGGFSTMAKTEAGIAAFVASAVEMTKRIGLDGIDLDWEYPTIGSAGIDHAPEDKQNFTALLAALRKAQDEEFPDAYKMLTIAAGAGRYYLDAVEIEKIVPLLDYISVMTYDMAGAWTPASHHTALYPTTLPGLNRPAGSVDTSVRAYRAAGVPAEKLVIGAAFYSRRWTHVKPGASRGFGERCYDPEDKESGFWGPGFGEIAEKLLDHASPDSAGWTLNEDLSAHARWLYNEEKEEFLSFDDEKSVREKAKYAAEKNLCGVMYWEHSCDPTRRLLDALAAEIKG